MKLFICRLRSLIESRDMTQKELAKAIDVTEVTISRYLSGDRSPRIDIVNKIAKYFNVSTDYLLGSDEVETIAAHHEGEDYTKEELEQIEAFKAFVRSKRENKDNRGD